MIKQILFTSFSIISSIALYAQDPIPSQNSGGNVCINPALAGNNSTGRLALNYRNQWPSLAGNYQTLNGNFYQYIPKSNGYGGIRFQNDNQAGYLNTRSTSLFYGQNINLGNILIRPAVEIGFVQSKLDWSKVTFGDMIDPKNGFVYATGEVPKSKTNYIDINVGAVAAYKNLTIGFSAHHINNPNVSLLSGPAYRLPARLGAQFSYVQKCEKIKLDVAPFALYFYQNGFQNLRGGINFLYRNHYNLSLATSNRDVFIFNVGFQTKVFAINYSYDLYTSRLNNNISGGAHEISLVFKFWKRKPIKRLIELNSVFQ